MAEYIEKEEAIKLIREDKVEITPNLLTIAMLAAPNGYSVEDCYKAINDTCDRHIKEIRNLQASDVVDRKKGNWIHFSRSDECSVCGYDTGKYEAPSRFCPNCGADMRGDA